MNHQFPFWSILFCKLCFTEGTSYCELMIAIIFVSVPFQKRRMNNKSKTSIPNTEYNIVLVSFFILIFTICFTFKIPITMTVSALCFFP